MICPSCGSENEAGRKFCGECARLGASRGEVAASEQGFRTAAARFRELGMPFCLAVTLLEHGEWLAAKGQGDEAEPLLAEAREIFERLEARPWLERTAQAVGARETAAV